MPVLGLLDGLPQTAAAGEQQGTVLIFAHGQAEEGAGCPVDGQNAAVLIQQDQPLVHAVQDQAHLIPLSGDGLDVAVQTLHQLVDVPQDGPQLVVGLIGLQGGGSGPGAV